ncbi:MAG: hypothetical protein LBI93_06005 [Endomicrobium sp.]|jgi:hypothetical protein|nr:hypothetical protein [Endomicrobium sp.]
MKRFSIPIERSYFFFFFTVFFLGAAFFFLHPQAILGSFWEVIPCFYFRALIAESLDASDILIKK